MRVQACVGSDFSAACHALAMLVKEGFMPDLVVGIQRGGAEVAREFAKQNLLDTNYCTVSTSRPLSGKKICLRGVMQFVPRSALDKVRTLEHRIRVHRFNAGSLSGREVRDVGESAILLRAASRVLIVDDAIDTGETLLSVLEHVNSLSSAADVRTAALAVTFPNPLVDADYTLYRGMLLRFPWSADTGGRR